MSLLELESRNCLFLVCPTDNIENVLNKIDCGKTFFYTSLGASFSWDTPTQRNIINVIKNQNIDRLIFVTKSDNQFYKDTDYSFCGAALAINQALARLEKKLPNYLLQDSHPLLRIMLIASRHLLKQRKQIIETSLLGNMIKQQGIVTKSYVYHPENKEFYTSSSIENKVLLYGKLSLN